MFSSYWKGFQPPLAQLRAKTKENATHEGQHLGTIDDFWEVELRY